MTNRASMKKCLTSTMVPANVHRLSSAPRVRICPRIPGQKSRACRWSNFSTRVVPLLAYLIGCKAAPTHEAPDMTQRSQANDTRTESASAYARVRASVATTPQSSEQAPAFLAATLTLKAPGDAIALLLASKPRVIAFGESHAPRELAHIRSATARFTRELLPQMPAYARALVLELWVANPKCSRTAVAAVEQRTAPITQPQRATNSTEFFQLGEAAKARGIMPFALVPPCDVYAKINAAGEQDIMAMLEQVARSTAAEVGKQLSAKPEALVLAYGGALHNDLVPRPGWASASFGPELARATAGRIVECDLVVPEFVQPTLSWQEQPWYPTYVALGDLSAPTLIHYAPQRFALVFARTATK
jgi:hypothetical protein